MFDFAAHLGTTTRLVESLERDGKPAKAVIATRHYETHIDDLWHALTDPERLPRWFLPVEGDLRLGGTYQFRGNAGGTITECDPPARLALTWEMRGDVSWVSVDLAPEGDGTRLTLRHEAHIPEDFWPVFGPGAVGVGWDLALMALARHLAAPEAPMPSAEEAEAWTTTSPEGREFVRAASAAWGRAAIADGTPEADALAAAERTRAFYTGDGQPGA